MRQVLHLMTILSEGELKLTAKGYIPPKIVDELYHMGSQSWSTDWFKQKSEPKTEEVQVLRVAAYRLLYGRICQSLSDDVVL